MNIELNFTLGHELIYILINNEHRKYLNDAYMELLIGLTQLKIFEYLFNLLKNFTFKFIVIFICNRLLYIEKSYLFLYYFIFYIKN